MLNALTVDVEEYFQVEAFAATIRPDDWPRFPSRVLESTLRLLDLLERRGASATFFVLGWVADRHPALLREIRERGHEVACHSYAHRLIYTLDPEAFRADVRRAKRAIQDALGEPIIGYRAPSFSVVSDSLWALQVLAEEGFLYDSSIFPIWHDRYGIPLARRFPHRVALPGGSEIAEFPMTTVQAAGQRFPFAGGGYFRLWPYPVVRACLRLVNRREAMPAILYIHPWELDPDQPRLPARGMTRFRHYVNLRHTAEKLDRLLSDFTFAPARQVLAKLGLLDVTPGPSERTTP
jgi:polysaccharide deacetylase family protein (PEP-CTERM system associated)